MALFNPMLGRVGTHSNALTGAKKYGPGMVGAATSGKLGSAGYNGRERRNDRKKQAERRKAIQQRKTGGSR